MPKLYIPDNIYETLLSKQLHLKGSRKVCNK